MTDILSVAQRSALMAKVRSRGNASTELRLIAVFRALGVTGWRRGATLRVAGLKAAGQGAKGRRSEDQKPQCEGPRGARQGAKGARFQVRPDFVFRAIRLAVFVDGCFWHGCPLHATRPRQNADFWRDKIAANQVRDRLVTRTLRACGWRVLRFWEHELRPSRLARLSARLRRHGLTWAVTSQPSRERESPAPRGTKLHAVFGARAIGARLDHEGKA
jgi:DNA mismatch endonuclease (patch repair protein)